MKKFAVFDIDGTVIRNSLFLQTLDELIAAGHLPAEVRARLDKKLAAYKGRKHPGAFNDYAQEAVDQLFGNMKGLAVKDYRKAVDKVIKRTKDHIYVFTRDLLKRLKKEGYFLIALSGSEAYAVEKFAAHYNFDVAVGEIYRENDGVFTGDVESVIYRKDEFVQQLVREHGLDFKGSVAIGDSQSDAKMLKLVERPIAFNPEQHLFAIARQKGWPIVVERKNVVYQLERQDGRYLLAQTD